MKKKLKKINKIKVLIWAPFGCGINYWGPGISAYRMYKDVNSDSKYELHVAHGFSGQLLYPCFKNGYYLGNATILQPLGAICFLVRSYFWIRKHASEFDVAHILGSHHVSFLPAVWLENRGIRCVLKIPNANSGFSGNSLVSKILGLARYRKRKKNKITKYICLSSTIEEELLTIGVFQNKLERIPNGVDVNRFFPLSDTEKSKRKADLGWEDKLVIISVGEITMRKYQRILVDLFDRFPELDIRVIIVGPSGKEGNDVPYIQEQIRSLHLADKIKMIGYTNDVLYYYQMADLFVLASDNEGLSNSMLEAMSCGLPALVTPVSGALDVIQPNSNGFFIDRDAGDLAEKLKLYCNDKALLLDQSIRARKTIEDGFSHETVLHQHFSLFNEIKN